MSLRFEVVFPYLQKMYGKDVRKDLKTTTTIINIHLFKLHVEKIWWALRLFSVFR